MGRVWVENDFVVEGPVERLVSKCGFVTVEHLLVFCVCILKKKKNEFICKVCVSVCVCVVKKRERAGKKKRKTDRKE